MEDSVTPGDPLVQSVRQRLTFFLAVLVPLIFLWFGYLDPLLRALDHPESHPDFRAAYFTAVDLRYGDFPNKSGKIPGPTAGDRLAERYRVDRNGGGYLPIVETLYLPLTYLEFPQAKAVWLTFNLWVTGCMIGLLLYLVRAEMGPSSVGLMALLVLCFLPVLRIFRCGQISLVMTLLILIGFVLFQAGHRGLAGVFFALGSIIKFFPGILFIGLLCRREWKVFFSGLLTLVFCLIFSVAFFGAGPHGVFLKELYSNFDIIIWWSNQSLLLFFVKTLQETIHYANPDRMLWAHLDFIVKWVWSVSVFLLLLVSLIVTFRNRKTPLVINLCLWLTCGVLMSPLTMDYTPVLLLPGAILLLWNRGTLPGANRVYPWLAYGLLAFPSVVVARFSFLHQAPLIFLTNIQTYGMLLLYVLLIKEHVKTSGV